MKEKVAMLRGVLSIIYVTNIIYFIYEIFIDILTNLFVYLSFYVV